MYSENHRAGSFSVPEPQRHQGEGNHIVPVALTARECRRSEATFFLHRFIASKGRKSQESKEGFKGRAAYGKTHTQDHKPGHLHLQTVSDPQFPLLPLRASGQRALAALPLTEASSSGPLPYPGGCHRCPEPGGLFGLVTMASWISIKLATQRSHIPSAF